MLIQETSPPAAGSAVPVFDRRLKEERDWWLARLTPLPRPLSPLAGGPTAGVAPAGRSAVGTDLPAPLGAELRRLTRDSPFLLHAALLAAVAACLHRLTGESAVCVGSPALVGAGARPPAPNALAVVVDVDPDRPFRDLLLAVREELLAAHARQSYPFHRLLEDLEARAEDGRCPLFDIAVGLPEAHTALPDAGHGLTLWLDRAGGLLAVRAETDSWRYRASDAARFVLQVLQLLASALREPAAPLAALDLLTPAERHQVLVEWNDTERPASGLPVHRLVAAQVARTPAAVAVLAEGRAWTYGEIDRRANRLARLLRSLGVGGDERVALWVDRSVHRVIALLAVLKAGGAYVPLDPLHPAERLATLLADARPRVLLAAGSLPAPPPTEAAMVLLDGEPDAGLPETPLPEVAEPASLAYVLYTSGSTGRPKGVAMAHHALSSLLEWQLREPALGRGARRLQFASLGFDESFREIFSTLAAGGTLVLVPEEVQRDVPRLARALAEHAVDKLLVPAVVLQRLCEELDGARELPPLLEVSTSGEQLRVGPTVVRLFARAWRERGCTLHNHYGPTETHVASACDLSGDPAAWPALPPIGRPIANDRIVLLDPGMRPLPAGVPGELWIGGHGLARGYLGRPDLTAERFLPDPFGAPDGRLYRTGDLARHLPDGSIEYLGRLDFQVKIRGVRIEPGEIEAALDAHPEIRETAVVAREHPAGGARLVAYVVPAGSEAPPAGELRAYLLERLPEPMVPAVFVSLDALPLNRNGKVDRRALPNPDAARPDLGVPWVAPRTAVEEVAARLWSGLLGVEQVGAQDDFFALGGHSLLATQLTARVRKVFRVELPLARLFARPTLEGMAGEIAGLRGSVEVAEEIARLYLTANGGAELAGPEGLGRFEELLRARGLDLPCAEDIPRRAGGGPSPLSLTQERIWFQEQVEGGGATYNLMAAVRLQGPLDSAALSRSADEIVRRHEALRTSFRVERGVPLQVVAPAPAGLVRWVDLSAVPDRDAEVRRLAAAEAGRPFDLTAGPLLRLAVVRFGGDDHVLVLTLHHIVSDGWSQGVFVRELAALYRAFTAGRPSPLPELPVQYRDFALWQREWLQGEVLAAQLGYWRDRLAGAPRLLRLPADRPRPARQSSRGGVRPWRLPSVPLAGLRALCRAEGATLFMGLLAAFKALLRVVCGQDDVVVGTDVANRGRREIEGLIGFFVNSLVLRTGLGGDPTFRELLGRVRETTLGAYGHQDLPFSRLVEELRPERDPGHHPFYQAVLILHNFPLRPQESSGLALTPFPVHGGAAKFDLSLYLTESGDELEGLVEYNAELFEDGTIVRLLEQYRAVLDAMVADPGRRLSGLTLGSAGQAAVDNFNENLEAD